MIKSLLESIKSYAEEENLKFAFVLDFCNFVNMLDEQEIQAWVVKNNEPRFLKNSRALIDYVNRVGVEGYEADDEMVSLICNDGNRFSVEVI